MYNCHFYAATAQVQIVQVLQNIYCSSKLCLSKTQSLSTTEILHIGDLYAGNLVQYVCPSTFLIYNNGNLFFFNSEDLGILIIYPLKKDCSLTCAGIRKPRRIMSLSKVLAVPTGTGNTNLKCKYSPHESKKFTDLGFAYTCHLFKSCSVYKFLPHWFFDARFQIV